MGRRKIEIQPITHERNRSVTFLKRKNGLFKKAYELGVLCSVDVAVIIFEERPGHHVKLYQYCSGNIDDIVQRHARYDGEKDIRAPNDFSTSTKLDDAAEGDDDDVEDDELEPPPARGSAGIKRGEDIRPRTEPGPGPKLRPSAGNGSGMDMDYLGHRQMIIPNPPMSMASSIPISGERLHPAPRMSSGSEMQGGSGPNKKPRIAPNMDGGRGRSPQDEISPTVSDYGYHPVPAPHVYRGLHPSEQYAPYLSPQSFPGSSFDYPPSRGQYRTMNYPPARSMPPYMQHSDQHFMRPVHHQYQQHHPGYPPMMTPQQHPSDVFSAFLDADPRQQHTGQGFAPIDWPVHAPPQQGRPNHSQGDPSDISWFDFLSSSAPNPSSGPMPASSSSLPTSARDNMSWEREWPSTSNAAVASRSPSRLSSNASDIASHLHKRSRVESDASGGYGNDKGKDIEMRSTASGTNAIKKLGDGRGQGVEHDSDKES